MYGVLTAISPGCVAFSLPVQRWNLLILEIPAFSAPPFRASASRAAGKKGRLPARGAFGPAHLRSRAGLSSDGPRYRTPARGSQVIFRRERYSSAKHLTSITWPAATTDK